MNEEIVKLLTAAEQGDTDAQTKVGFCYYVGQGVEQNYNLAVYWFSKAAERNNATAQNCMGICYASGQGVPADKEKAKYWWQRAAANGDENAKAYLKKYFNL